MKLLFSLLCLIFYLTIFHTSKIFAQQTVVQWAYKVDDFSSEKSTDYSPQYKAIQVLGKPNKLPAGGESACAWMPKEENNSKGEWIKVSFANPMQIRQVAIAENFNPGAVSQIFLYDEKGTEYPAVYNQLNVENLNSGARIFSIYLPLTSFKVEAIKVVLNTEKIAGFNQIDAIGISNSEEPIKAEINLAEDVEVLSKPENLGTSINSIYQEVSPMISPDGNTMYFTRTDHPQNTGEDKRQDVWVAYKNESGIWENAENIGTPINTIHHNASFSIAPDGNKMLLNNVYLSDGSLKKGVSTTIKGSDGEWQFPKEVIIDGYYNNNRYSEFCLSGDGRTLLMTIERDDTNGGKDIYVSFLQEETNTWSIPLNLGNVVNTADSETSPFLALDGQTLYYSTSGMSGYGSNDIFITRRLDDTWQNWSEPKNVGPEINTPNWDAYFTIPASGEYAYYTSYHASLGESDIFRVRLSEKNRPKPVVLLQGTVYDEQTGEALEAELIYELFPEGETMGEALSNGQTGEYKVILPFGKKYGLLAEARGFFPLEEIIDLSETPENYQEITQDIYLTPIGKGQKLKLKNIFFVRGKAQLMPESYRELDRLIRILQENPSLKIRLEGHTEPYGDAKALKKLSKSRVLEVGKFLISRGIDERRIKYKAYGGKRPITNDPQERMINRRVEVVIL